MRAAAAASSVGGDHDLGAADLVLRGVVVPVAGARDDLGDRRRDRLGVAEHAALDLAPVDRRLDEHLLVVRERRARSAAASSSPVGDARDADARAERRGLDEDRPAERLADPAGQRRVVRIVAAVAQRQRRRDARCRRRAARSCRDPCPSRPRSRARRSRRREPDRLEQALHRPVLAERPVQHGEHHVDPGERRGARRRPASRARASPGRSAAGSDDGLAPGSSSSATLAEQPPGAVLADRDRQHLVARGIERGRDRARRREGDLALGRAAPRQHDDAQPSLTGSGSALAASCRSSSCPSWSCRRRGGRVVVHADDHGRALRARASRAAARSSCTVPVERRVVSSGSSTASAARGRRPGSSAWRPPSCGRRPRA